jgi:HEAT repeat protein
MESSIVTTQVNQTNGQTPWAAWAAIPVVVFQVTTLACAWRSPAMAEEFRKEQELLAVLRSDAAEAEKAITCKHLAVYGSSSAVTDLAALLGNERLASWARIPLESIPGPEADSALRQAAGSGELSGVLLVGVINSIGVRRDPVSVPLLNGCLENADPQVRAASAAALGRIGTREAAAVLSRALAVERPEEAVAEAGVVCAERLTAPGGSAADAAIGRDLFHQIRLAGVSPQRQAEAWRGAILAGGPEGIDLLVQLLRSPSRRLFHMGLFTAREVGHRPGDRPELASGVDAALVEELAVLRGKEASGVDGDPRSRRVIEVLADRHTTRPAEEASQAVRIALAEAAAAGPTATRLAAVDALGRVGDATAVGPLLAVAGNADAEFASAVRRAIAGLSDPAVDEEIRRRLAGADGTTLPTLIALVGDRRIPATADVVGRIDDPSADVRAAALAALGSIAQLDQLDVLVERATATPEGFAVDQPLAQRALREAAVRMEDREGCAAKLASALPKADMAGQVMLLEVLGEVGGRGALSALAAAAHSADVTLQDAATRLLGRWMTADAAPVLLELAQPVAPGRFRTRALRGYIRIARQFTLPDAERSAMCRRALAAATEEVDVKAILEILARYPSPAMLEVAREAARRPGLEDEAESVIRAIESKLAVPAG